MNESDQYESSNVTFMAPTKAGWLTKLPRNILYTATERWFVLIDGCLYYFNQPHDEKPRGIIPLDNVTIEFNDNHLTRFALVSNNGGVIKSSKIKSGVMIRGTRNKFTFEASDADERDHWVKILQGEAARFRPMNDIFIKLQENKASRYSRYSITNSSGWRNSLKYQKEAILQLPKPLARGWMRKQSSGTSSSGWTRRYFVLFPEFDNQGPTLFYYLSKESAQMMIDLGSQTQSGYLRMKNVMKVILLDEDSFPSIRLDISTSTSTSGSSSGGGGGSDGGGNINKDNNTTTTNNNTNTTIINGETNTTTTDTESPEEFSSSIYWIFVPEAVKEADNDYDSVYESDVESVNGNDDSTCGGDDDDDIDIMDKSWETKAQQWYEALRVSSAAGNYEVLNEFMMMLNEYNG